MTRIPDSFQPHPKLDEAARINTTPRFVARLTAIPPLPEGEGRGEGERLMDILAFPYSILPSHKPA